MPLFRSRAPLRIGLAGGGTDVSPFSDLYGGVVLNATVDLYAHASLEPLDSRVIVIQSTDQNEYESSTGEEMLLKLDGGKLDLLKGVCLSMISRYGINCGFRLSTHLDAPGGSGLGTSSTLCVAIIGVFVEWLKLPMGEYEIAQLAFEIERVDLKLSGGKQDQFCATFGGVNFMEFYGEKVVVNPLRIKPQYLIELEQTLVLYYTGNSRLSSKIIEAQIKCVTSEDPSALEATHDLKKQAIMMKEALLLGKLNLIGTILDYGWERKKKLSSVVTNPLLDEIYSTAKENGALGGKISGAGGGGFMLFYCPSFSRFQVCRALQKFEGEIRRFHFSNRGLISWQSS